VRENPNLALEEMAKLMVRVKGSDDLGQFGYELGKWWDANESLEKETSALDYLMTNMKDDQKAAEESISSDLTELGNLIGIKLANEEGKLTPQGYIFFGLTLLMPLILIWLLASLLSSTLAQFVDTPSSLPWN